MTTRWTATGADATWSVGPASVPMWSSATPTSGQPLGQVVAHPQGVRDGRQGGVHGADAGEEAGVDHVQVVHVVGLAVDVQGARGGIAAEADSSCLVGRRAD